MKLYKALKASYQKIQMGAEGIRKDDLKRIGDFEIAPYLKNLEDSFDGKNLWWHLLYAIRKEVAVFLLTGVLLSIISPALALVLEALFDSLSRPDSYGTARFAQIVVGISFLLLANLVVRWYQDLRESRTILIIYQVMVRFLFRRLQRINLSDLEKEKKEPLAYITSYAPQVTQVMYVLDFLMTSVLICVLVGIFFVWFDFAAFAVLAMVAVITVILQRLIVIIGKVYHKYLSSDHLRTAIVKNSLSDLPVLKRQYFEPQVLVALSDARSEQLPILRERARWQVINRSLEDNIVPLASLALVGVTVWMNQIITPSQIFPILFLLGMLMRAIENNLANFRVLRNTQGPLKEIETLFNRYPVSDHMSDSPKRSTCFNQDGMSIYYKNKRFTFPIKQGGRVAIVGRTGVGKTHLLLELAGERFVDSTSQALSFNNGIYVGRNQPVFNTSLAEQVTLWDRPVDLEKYKNVLRLSCLAEDIELMKEGDARVLSQESPNLSEGQLQRLFLAQALYAEPDVLLLDDTFAPMNPKLAHRVAGLLFGEPSLDQVTRLFVTSRFELLPYADHILVLGDDDVHCFQPLDFTEQDVNSAQTLLGNELSDTMFAQLLQPKVWPEAHPATDMKKMRRYVFPADTSDVQLDALDEAEEQEIHIRDLVRNILSLFSPTVLVGIGLVTSLAIVANMFIAALIERWPTAGLGDWTLLGLLALCVILSIGLAAFRYSLSFFHPISNIDRLHRLFYQHLLRGRKQQEHIGKLIGRLTADFTSLEMSIPNQVISIGAGFLEFVFYSIFFAITTPISLVILVPFGFFAASGYKRAKAIIVASARLKASVRGPVFSFVGPSLNGHGYRLSGHYRGLLEKRYFDLADLQTKGSFWGYMGSMRASLFIRSIGILMFFAILWPLSVILSISDFVSSSVAPSLVIFLALTFSERVAGLIDQVQQSDVLLTLFERLAELIDEPVLPSYTEVLENDMEDNAVFYASLLDATSRADYKPPARLSAIDIRYGYEENQRLFDGLHLDILSAERIALTGPSGVGKTSIVRLMSGVIQPDKGEIKLGDVQPNNYDGATRELIVVAESSVPVLPITVQQFLDPFNRHSTDDILEIISKIDLSIHDFSDGLKTPLKELSLGQKQIFNLLRAVLAKPWIIIIDEASSGLDSLDERSLLQSLFALTPDITYLAILHRPDNLDVFDKVYHLDDGQLTLEQSTAEHAPT